MICVCVSEGLREQKPPGGRAGNASRRAECELFGKQAVVPRKSGRKETKTKLKGCAFVVASLQPDQIKLFNPINLYKVHLDCGLVFQLFPPKKKDGSSVSVVLQLATRRRLRGVSGCHCGLKWKKKENLTVYVSITGLEMQLELFFSFDQDNFLFCHFTGKHPKR